MTVQELIDQLEKFPKDMRVIDSSCMDIERVFEMPFTHDNYPYNKPDEQVIVIE